MPGLSRNVERTMTSRTARDYLLYSLQNRLYSDFYCQGFAVPLIDDDTTSMMANTPFIHALSAANAGMGCHEDGWEIRTIEGDVMIVHRDGLELRARREDCPDERERLAAGAKITLRLPKEYLNMSPGFYMALGNRQLSYSNAETLLRFYWNLSPDGAIPFLHTATQQLNSLRLPFRLKVLRDPAFYTRCDAGVIYALQRDYGDISRMMMQIYGEIEHYLKSAVPAFTKRLAPGLGLAEDPGGRESFGEHRCRLVADALIAAYEAETKIAEERLEMVVNRFEQEGVDIDTPYLNAGSTDVYQFSVSV